MKTVFDIATRDELVKRISNLNADSHAQWGKMNVYQVVEHCIFAEEMYLGKKAYKQMFLGRLFGKVALRQLLKDENPMGHNAPTNPDFKLTEAETDLAARKAVWQSLINEYGDDNINGFYHFFFGKLDKDEVGYLAYKHIDHHLRQFNC